MLTGKELRNQYLAFFDARDHLILPSASLIPQNDPSLLLTVAGMVPFKPYFQGKEKPPHPRVTTSQKCLRTADLEVVGKTARHQTFFEMLGNFSFGDYFKREAIAWSWEYLTKVLGLDPNDLWITVYQDDREATRIWHREIGVPEERIVPLGDNSNFWAAGPVGPCGPCSEIMVDLGPARGCGSPDCGVDCDCGRYLEVWNLVFTEFNRDEEGKLSPLPRKNIDTGMGLERIASVMQGVPSNFETDLLFPLIEETAKLTKNSYGAGRKSDVAFKVIADHARAVAFLISDGVTPSNEGRGYILRRILRRAIRYGRLLGIEGKFLTKITAKVIEQLADPYRELRERADYIEHIVSLEEERFSSTLEQGLQILQDDLALLEERKYKLLSGEAAFRLYDTYGFPLELTQEILAERGMAVDLDGFQKAMESQRERARAAWLEAAPVNSFGEGPVYRGLKTSFQGYGSLASRAEVQAIFTGRNEVELAGEGEEVQVILDVTPFYPEGGGQVGDRGTIGGPAGEILVEDTKKAGSGLIVHYGRISRGKISRGDLMLAQVDEERRLAAARNHTATHLLQKALRTVLGDHVQQMGSLVEPERLRFDFPHYAAVTPDELCRVEDLVNQEILRDLIVKTYETERKKALAAGATALFGEKYGEVVRVVEIGDFSKELCGGTHVHRTSQLGFFKIVSESGIGTGVRRIEAITGDQLLKYWRTQDELLRRVAEELKTSVEGIPVKVEQIQQREREAEHQLQQLRSQLMRTSLDDLLKQVENIGGVPVLAVRVQAADMENLRSTGDLLRDKLASGVLLLGSELDGKVGLVCFITPDLVKGKGLHAGKLIKEISRLVGGGGGGKAEMAQAGGKDLAHLDAALKRGKEMVAGLLVRK